MGKGTIRLGILGGTFNPPHSGHAFLATQLCGEFALDRVIFLPVGNPPHKRGIALASAEQRLHMLALLTREMPFAEISTLELDRPGYTYTVDSLEAFAQMHPHAALFYIIGSDTLFELETWRNFARVAALTAFICVPRPGDARARMQREIDALARRYGARIQVARCEGPRISSTEMRRIAAAGGTLAGMAPQALADYIITERIYHGETGSFEPAGAPGERKAP